MDPEKQTPKEEKPRKPRRKAALYHFPTLGVSVRAVSQVRATEIAIKKAADAQNSR